jgi:hypothetical protein
MRLPVYLLVEIEHPAHRLFLGDGHASRELTHARGQLQDWKRYIEDNLATVQRELGLVNISTNPRGLIVIGRSAGLDREDRRKLVTMENESPKVKVLTYDDVLDVGRAVVGNVLGPLWNVVGDTEIYNLSPGALAKLR